MRFIKKIIEDAEEIGEHVTVLGKEYSVSDFRRLLYKTNKGIFKKIKYPIGFAGPRFFERDISILGASRGIEESAFDLHSTDEQKEVHKQLKKRNKPLAWEYVMVIEKSINVWKRSIKTLQELLDFFKEEEEIVKKEEKHVRKRIAEALKRRLPKVYDKMRGKLENTETSLLDLLRALEQYDHRIAAELEKDERELPFLFE